VAAVRGFFFLLSVPFFLSGIAMAIPYSFLGLRPARSMRRPSQDRRPVPRRAPVPHARADRVAPAPALGLGAVACAFVVSNKGGGLRKGRGAALCVVLFLLVIPPADIKLSPYKDLAAVRNLPGRGRSHPAPEYRAITGRSLPRRSIARRG